MKVRAYDVGWCGLMLVAMGLAFTFSKPWMVWTQSTVCAFSFGIHLSRIVRDLKRPTTPDRPN